MFRKQDFGGFGKDIRSLWQFVSTRAGRSQPVSPGGPHRLNPLGTVAEQGGRVGLGSMGVCDCAWLCGRGSPGP